MDTETVKLIGSGGFGAALLALIAWLGKRLIAAMGEHRKATTTALDKLGDKVDANTTATREEVGELRRDLAVLGARVEVWTGSPREIPREISSGGHAAAGHRGGR